MASGFHIYCLQRIWDKLLSQVEEFKYLGVLFMSKGRVEHEIDGWIGLVSTAMWSLYQSAVVKTELSMKVKLSIYWSIYVPALACGHDL